MPRCPPGRGEIGEETGTLQGLELPSHDDLPRGIDGSMWNTRLREIKTVVITPHRARLLCLVSFADDYFRYSMSLSRPSVREFLYRNFTARPCLSEF